MNNDSLKSFLKHHDMIIPSPPVDEAHKIWAAIELSKRQKDHRRRWWRAGLLAASLFFMMLWWMLPRQAGDGVDQVANQSFMTDSEPWEEDAQADSLWDEWIDLAYAL